ncbi:MAG TPA: TIGR03435 family protein [Candidatus Sulfotelmatobacter sp.]
MTPVGNHIFKVDPTAARYDIVANVPAGTTKAQAREMLKNLLVDRFKLTYHLEKRNFDGYAATRAKEGVKLRPSDPAKGSEAAPLAAKFTLGPDGFAEVPAGEPAIVAVIVDGSGKVRWSVRNVPVSSLLEMLGQFYPLAARLGGAESSAGYIFDDTGLAGKYDFKFEYPLSAFQFGRALEYASGAATFADRSLNVSWKGIVRFQSATDIKSEFAALAKEALADQPESDPALLAAIEKQLGIRLVKSKVPLDVVTVDRVEKMPTEN